MTETAEAPAIPDHPAEWLADGLMRAASWLEEGRSRGWTPPRPPRVLDPFAGVGNIHKLRDIVLGGAVTVGLELEPEWAAAHPGTVAGDVLAMPLEWRGAFDAVVSSPCYGNRMADDHNARDDSERNTYRHKLGRPLSPGSSAGMQWGNQYRTFHRDAIHALLGVLAPGGLIVWNVKNHYRTKRKGDEPEEQLVAEWHLRTWLDAGARLVRVHDITARGNRQGANGTLRTEAEFLFLLRAPATARLL